MTRQTLFAILSVTMGIAVSLVAFEIGLRVLVKGSGISPREPDPVFHHIHQKDFSFLSFSPDGEWNAGRIYYAPDGTVTRPADAGAESPACRIAFLGDSFTEARHVPYDTSFIGRLDGASACEMKNYGVGGYSPILYLLQWERIIRATQPDLVILQLYSNDIRDDSEYANIAKYDENGRIVAVPSPASGQSLLSLTRSVARQSYLLQIVFTAMTQVTWWMRHRGEPVHIIGGYVEEFPDISPLTSGLVNELKRQVAAAGSKLAIFVVPSKFRLAHRGESAPDTSEFSDKWKNWAANNDVEFADMVEPFRRAAEHGGMPFFERDIHFNATGHEIVANVLCERFPQYFDALTCQ